jgi:hypothetical protein
MEPSSITQSSFAIRRRFSKYIGKPGEKSTLRLPGLKPGVCSGLTLSGVFLLHLNGGLSAVERVKMKRPVIVLDEGAKDVGLAEMLFNLLSQNLEQNPQKLSSFGALKSNVVIVARDIDITVTLAFKGGELTIYDGIVGKADLKIVADHDAILALSLINIFMGLPNYLDKSGRDILKRLLRRSIQIEGLLKHPLQLTHLTKIFSVN